MLLMVILVVVVLTLVLVLLLFRLVRRLAHLVSSGAGNGTGTGAGGTPPGIPDHLDGPAIAGYLTTRLAGTPADGSVAPGPTPGKVVWVDGGDEVLVHLDSTSTQIVGQTVLVSIDLESDQTGRAARCRGRGPTRRRVPSRRPGSSGAGAVRRAAVRPRG